MDPSACRAKLVEYVDYLFVKGGDKELVLALRQAILGDDAFVLRVLLTYNGLKIDKGDKANG